MKDNQYNIFSVPIWGFVFKNEHYHAIDYRECILDMASKEPSSKKSNFGGWQSRDNIHQTEGIFREFVSSLNGIARTIMSNENLTVNEMWANINYKNCYNGAHTHSGIISGVFYLQTPADCGKLILINPAVRADGHILRPSNFPINPEPLACILFPSWLEHYVEPNHSDEPRISISFNIGVA